MRHLDRINPFGERSKPYTGRTGANKPYPHRTPNRKQPHVAFRRNRIGQWMPATPHDLEICMEQGVVLSPHLAPGDVIREVAGKVWVDFTGVEQCQQ